MKAQELMIGDWVKIKGHLDYDKVQEIARDENMQWYISFACSATLFRAYEFEPIPLTSEILEKNGFKFKNDSEFQISGERLLPDDTYIYIRFNKIETCHINLSHRGGMEDFELNIYIRKEYHQTESI